jgi:lactate dehydrogenase-like 2-hydroxyacid dehydrogenase
LSKPGETGSLRDVTEPGLPVVCATIALPPGVDARLRKVADLRLIAPPATQERVAPHLATAEGILCSALFPIDAALMDAAPRLRVVSNFGVGFNNVDLDEATRRDIAVCNTPDVLSAAVADLTLAMILAVSRRIVANAAYVQGGGWSRGAPAVPLGFDVGGRTLGIVGFGRIGRAVADRARAFGMRVLHHDMVREPGPGYDFADYRDLDDLLRESDIVTLHVNLTPKTHHLIGARELALMKPTACIVNTSRGPVIDQPALVAALRDGTIAAAALDVLETEPPSAADPILALPNVLVLPHIGSATVETRAAMLDLAVRNLEAVITGEHPPACVNPAALDRALQRR